MLYAATLYRHVSGGDAAELIAAVATTGIPHPPGFPLYVLLTKPFLWLPLLGVAGRANLAAAVMAAAAAAMLAWGVTKSSGRRAAGIGAAAAFAFSPTVWLYAVSAEVFSLNNLLIAIELALLVAVDAAVRAPVRDDRRLARLLYGASFVFGLGLCAHPTSSIFNGIFLAAMLWRAPRRPWSGVAGAALAGTLPYLYLPMAASRHPAIAWGETDTLAGFFSHVLRSEYGTFSLNSRLAPAGISLVRQLAYYASDLVHQVTWIGVGLAAFGIATAAARRDTRVPAVATASAYVLYLVLLHGLADFPLDQPLMHAIVARFWMAPNLLVCLWIGWALAAVRPAPAAAVAVVLLTGGQILLHWRGADHRHDVLVADYGAAILGSAPPGALAVTRGDLITNTSRYLQTVEHLRPDVRVLDQELLTFRWMTSQVRRQMPEVVLPGTHYDIAAPGAYSLRGLVDANIGRRPIVICGGTKPGDDSLAGNYRLVPVGLCERVVAASEPIDVRAWLAAADAGQPRFHADMRRIPERSSWEYAAWADYWESFHRVGVTCLTLAIERHDDAALLREAAARFERLIADDPEPSPFVYKNLGIAYARLAPVDPSAGPRAVEAWQRYLQIGPADPERPAIEDAVRAFSAAAAPRR